MNKSQVFRSGLAAFEFVLSIVCLGLVRAGGLDKAPLILVRVGGEDIYNTNALIWVTAYTLFPIIAVQLVSGLAGDKAPIGVSAQFNVFT